MVLLDSLCTYTASNKVYFLLIWGRLHRNVHHQKVWEVVEEVRQRETAAAEVEDEWRATGSLSEVNENPCAACSFDQGSWASTTAPSIRSDKKSHSRGKHTPRTLRFECSAWHTEDRQTHTQTHSQGWNSLWHTLIQQYCGCNWVKKIRGLLWDIYGTIREN